MPRNVLNDIVSWQTRRPNNSTKYQLHALMTIISKKKNWNPWENFEKSMLSNRLSQVFVHFVIDRASLFTDQRISGLPIRAKYKHSRTIGLVWSLTFTTHVNTNSIAMRETLPNNADWDCFKTPILQEIFRAQNLHHVEQCPFWEVIRLFQSVGCVRNKLPFRTVQQNQKSSLWMQDWGWMVHPHLISRIWSSQFLETHESE